jgi:lysozyme family protein
MASSTYKAFVDRMISKYEGGYGWNKKDPGGPTNFGITCYDLAEHRHQKMTSMASWAPLVKAMTLAEAEDIYREKYAVAVHYDELPAGIDACMMDYGVNSGTARPILVAHRLLNVPGTGMTNALLDAIKATDAATFISKMCAERLTFMHGIKGGASWAEFGRGWQSRVDDLKTYATRLVMGVQTQEAVDLSAVTTPKATHVANDATTPTAVAAVSSAGAAYAAGVPWYTIAAIVVGVIIAGIAYEIWHEAKTAAANNAVSV